MTRGRPDSTELMKWLPWETIHIKKKLQHIIHFNEVSVDDKTTKEGREFHKVIPLIKKRVHTLKRA